MSIDKDKHWLNEFYRDLKVLEIAVFPKKCQFCGEVYTDFNDFLARTKPVHQSSGLAKYRHGHKVGLFRNCKCHSTLMVNCEDRRGSSPDKVSKREVFGRLLDMLIAKGLDKNTARKELLNILGSEESAILKSLGISVKQPL
jgi:hypothetical protein